MAAYQIVVEFPSKEIADEFCAQMSDGFGEGFCNFLNGKKCEGTDGSKREHWTHNIKDELGRDVYFVDAVFTD